MNTKQPIKIFARAMYCMVIAALVFSVTGSAYAQEPSPWLIAFPENDAVEGWEWTEGATVTLTINGVTDSDWSGIANVTTWGDPRTYVRIEFGADYNLQIGDIVELTDGIITITHTVQNLSVIDVNQDTDTLSGTAEAGVFVSVWPHDHDQDATIQAKADEGGFWQANFTNLFSLVIGTCGRSQITDTSGNATAVDWCAPKPWFAVFPEWDVYVQAFDYPLGANVHLAINNPTTELNPDFEADQVTEVTPWSQNGAWAVFNLHPGYDVKPGDIVTLTSDGISPRVHIVQNLAVTKVDQEDDMVKGTADAGADVYVWPHTTGEQQMVTANPKGKWNVDFTGIYNLMPKDGGRAEIRDEMGNTTAVDWYIPQPRFTIYPDAQWFDGMDWPDGATVTITVKGKPMCTLTKESWGGFFNGGFPEGCVVTAGDKVTFTDGIITSKHTVRNLAITMIDKDANTVTGIANTGAVIHTWVWVSDGSTLDGSNLEVTAENGKWLADFGALAVDLEEGMGIQAEILDENGNATSVDLNVPDPRIVVSITEDWFYLVDFLPGSPLDLSIYKSQGGDLIWSNGEQEIKADVNGFAWIEPEGWDLEPGNYLVVSDGDTTKDLEIEGLTFDIFNLSNGQLSGTAPEPYGSRTVWVGIGWQDQDAWTMNVTTDGGAWIADFGQPVPGDYWWVAAQIFDSDGDASELRPSQIYPTLFAWLEWDQVDGHGWREGEAITLSINGDEHVLIRVAGTTKIIFDVGETGHDLTVGDQITMADGLITKQLLIPDLKITDYDLGAKAISGTYDPNLGFRTYVNGQASIDVVFDGNAWTAYYEDLGPLMWGDAVQRDADSDEVAATIHTPNPNLYALPDENKIFAQEWIAGFDLKLAIYNSIGEELHTDTKMVEPPSEVPWTVVIFEDFDIEPGQRIVLSQRGYERELLVSSLRVTGFNFATQQIMGTGDAGAQIFVRINGQDVPGVVGVDGKWTIAHPQLAHGVWGEAIQRDGIDGDETRDGFQAQ